MLVTLKNVSRRSQSYNLAHGFFEDGKSDLHFRKITVTVVDHAPRTGKLRARRIEKSVCAGLHFAADETRRNLPEEVLDCSEISGAVARGELRILSRTKVEKEPAPAAPAPDDPKTPKSSPATAPAKGA